jgi:hypothetical protein
MYYFNLFNGSLGVGHCTSCVYDLSPLLDKIILLTKKSIICSMEMRSYET